MKPGDLNEPSAEELAELLELEIDEVNASLGTSARHISVDTPLGEGEDNTLVDVMENVNADLAETRIEHDESLLQEIERSMSSLTERQKEVICYFFGLGTDHPMTLEDIGEKFNLTRERVRQIKDKALTKMRTNPRAPALKSFMGK